jgi:hypothetical protein
MKSFSGHLPFGTKDAYVKEIMGADLDELANLVRICGFLMQTKAYLFWRSSKTGAFTPTPRACFPQILAALDIKLQPHEL